MGTVFPKKKKKKALWDCHDLGLNSGHSCSGQPVINFIEIEVDSGQ